MPANLSASVGDEVDPGVDGWWARKEIQPEVRSLQMLAIWIGCSRLVAGSKAAEWMACTERARQVSPRHALQKPDRTALVMLTSGRLAWL